MWRNSLCFVKIFQSHFILKKSSFCTFSIISVINMNIWTFKKNGNAKYTTFLSSLSLLLIKWLLQIITYFHPLAAKHSCFLCGLNGDNRAWLYCFRSVVFWGKSLSLLLLIEFKLIYLIERWIGLLNPIKKIILTIGNNYTY